MKILDSFSRISFGFKYEYLIKSSADDKDFAVVYERVYERKGGQSWSILESKKYEICADEIEEFKYYFA